MPLFDVRLESQTDSQWRQMTVEVPGVIAAHNREAYARALCARQEQSLVDFSLAAPTPPPAAPDTQDVEVLVAYINAQEAYAQDAKDATVGGYEPNLLQALEAKHGVDKGGKAFGPTRIGKGHIHLHRQTLPYIVTDVKEMIPSVKELVRAALALNHHEGRWEQALREMREAGLPINAVTASLYGIPWQKQIDGSAVTVFSSAAIQTSLHTGYTQGSTNDTYDFFDDVSATEITGTGYTAKGVTLASKASTYDTATDQIRLDAADVSWTTSTLSATDAVVWVDTAGISSTDPVWGSVDFGATVTTTAGTFLITWDATGIVVYDVT